MLKSYTVVPQNMTVFGKKVFKEVIMLCEIYGYSYEEASKKLNCPIGTIKSRIFNAKKELAVILSDLM